METYAGILTVCLILVFLAPACYAVIGEHQTYTYYVEDPDSGDYTKLAKETYNSWVKSGFFHAIQLYLDGRDAGLSIPEAFYRDRSLLNCQEERYSSCSTEGNVLDSYIWRPGCHGESDECCVSVSIDCNNIMSLGENVAQNDIVIRDQRKLCIKNSCSSKDTCYNDEECKNILYCPNDAGGPTDVKCNTKTGKCYCASKCPDDYCDSNERLTGSCPADCGGSKNDNDYDGLSDLDEETIYGTRPDLADSDHDGLDDWQEIEKGSDPNDPDTDDGGQCDGPNEVSGVCRTGPDPCPLDSNNVCYAGVLEGDTIFSTDADQDGISNGRDICPINSPDNCQKGDDPDVDINYDGVPEGWSNEFRIDNADSDIDGDGLTNKGEYLAWTDPLDSDTDGDGLPDGFEVMYSIQSPTDDPDGDGLTNLQEYYAGTDPNKADTDGDGIIDGDEKLLPGENTTIIIKLLDVVPRDDDLDDGIYNFVYGQSIEQVTIEMKYSDGTSVISPAIFGDLEVMGGGKVVSLDFKKATSNTYVAYPDYGLLEKNNEAPYIRMDVEALDPLGTSGRFATKLFILEQDERIFRITVRKPSGTFAPGQRVDFDMGVDGSGLKEVMGDVLVEETGEDFALNSLGDSLVGDYTISRGTKGNLDFIVHATALSGGKVYDSVRRVSVAIDPTLGVEYLEGISAPGEAWFDVRYPNGEEVTEKTLTGMIYGRDAKGVQTKTAVILDRDDEGYYVLKTANLSVDEIYGTVRDSYGNIGRLAVSSDALVVSIDWGTPIGAVIVIIIVSFVGFVLFQQLKKRRDEEKEKSAEKSKLANRRDEVKELIESTKKRYYKKKLSQEEASRRITDYEEELRAIEKKISADSKKENKKEGLVSKAKDGQVGQ